ncbi:hypothetical protein [Pseudodesulfovibrio sp.]|uniref:hypothetical protein n=1 Tax=unclassified Pseudodesulfovibrio TaxID=2661612 RepID=UPI003B00D642
MNKAAYRNILSLIALPLLSGCLVINALLGVAGLVGSGTVQYASTAYSVCEYGYQYTVNDKTPDEVIVEKLAFLIGPAEDETEQVDMTRLATVAPREHPLLEERSHSQAPKFVKSTPIIAPRTIETAQAVTQSPQVIAKATLIPAPTPRPTSRRTVVNIHAVAKAEPPATASASPPAATDPSLTRMARLGQCLAAAERISLNRPETGLRLPAGTNDAGQTAPEMSGGWFIRHQVMAAGPSAG